MIPKLRIQDAVLNLSGLNSWFICRLEKSYCGYTSFMRTNILQRCCREHKRHNNFSPAYKIPKFKHDFVENRKHDSGIEVQRDSLSSHAVQMI